MLPRWHILLGAIFTLSFWAFFPQTNLIHLALLFIATFLIDFDHYLASLIKTKNWNLSKSFEYHTQGEITERREKERGIRKKGDFHLFHTIEFHILIGLLSFLWVGFIYILIGMIFHSLLDFFWLVKKDRLYRREYLTINKFLTNNYK